MIDLLKFLAICTAIYMIGRGVRRLFEYLTLRAVHYFFPPRD